MLNINYFNVSAVSRKLTVTPAIWKTRQKRYLFLPNTVTQYTSFSFTKLPHTVKINPTKCPNNLKIIIIITRRTLRCFLLFRKCFGAQPPVFKFKSRDISHVVRFPGRDCRTRMRSYSLFDLRQRFRHIGWGLIYR